MARKKASSAPHLYAALFALVAREGWWGVTLPKLAKAAKIPVGELLKTYSDKNAVLEGFLAHVDQQLAEIDLSEANNLQERLFELVMRRVELMQEYRKGLVRLLEDAVTHPVSAVCLGLEMAPAARRSLKLVLELAEFPLRPPFSEVAVMGLKLVYLNTLRVWMRDDSKDLAPTMAAVDRGIEKFISLLKV
jgi:AcrR family transcriptional regulator